jgi:hypothetical protein
MNDLGLPNWNNAIHLDRQDRPAVERETGNAPKQRRRRRWGGRLVSLGGLLALAGGLSFGAWGNYSQHEEVMATARLESDFVPSLRVATAAPSPVQCR